MVEVITKGSHKYELNLKEKYLPVAIYDAKLASFFRHLCHDVF